MKLQECIVHFNVDYLDNLSREQISQVGEFVHNLLSQMKGRLYLEDFDGLHDFFGFFEGVSFTTESLRKDIQESLGFDIGKAISCM